MSFGNKIIFTDELIMLLTIIFSAITVLGMTDVVLTKPYAKIKNFNIGLYWVVTLFGALLLLATGCISLTSVWEGVTANTSVNPLKILTLFLSMTLISIYLGDAGFFDFIADFLFRKTKGSQLILFLSLYAVVSILTIFTSNDIIILTFTPAICIFAKKAGISPIPYLVGEFIGANTWSMALIVGNPTNVYLAQSAGIGFTEYMSVMILPAIVGGLTGLAVLLLLFRKTLKTPLSPTKGENQGYVRVNKTTMYASLIILVLCIVLLALADFIHVEMWLICFGSALILSLFIFFYDMTKLKSAKPLTKSLSKVPYELIPFVLSMFVIVLALKSNGVTDFLKSIMITGNKTDSLSIGFISALSSNLLNNIPMSVLFEGIVSNTNNYAIYGAIVGSNIGAFITPVGALAGIMWNKILSNHGVKLRFIKFVLYGTAVAIPTLLTTLLTLMLVA